MTGAPEWKPRSVRYGLAPEPVLVDGVPDYLRRPLSGWLNMHVEGDPDDYDITDYHHEIVDDYSYAQEIALTLRVPVTHDRTAIDALTRLALNSDADREKFLDAIDMSLNLTHGHGAALLERLLQQGGSAWSVADNRLSLVKRVPEEEVAAFALATEPEGEASDHLQVAWAKVYGRHQDADEAWNQAIKACEAIYIPIVEPNNTRATLGSTIGILRGQPSLWNVRLTHNPSGSSVLDELVAMLDVVWVDPNRHAGQPQPRHATIEDAENIVQLAVTLVGWARTGVLTRK